MIIDEIFDGDDDNKDGDDSLRYEYILIMMLVEDNKYIHRYWEIDGYKYN